MPSSNLEGEFTPFAPPATTSWRSSGRQFSTDPILGRDGVETSFLKQPHHFYTQRLDKLGGLKKSIGLNTEQSPHGSRLEWRLATAKDSVEVVQMNNMGTALFFDTVQDNGLDIHLRYEDTTLSLSTLSINHRTGDPAKYMDHRYKTLYQLIDNNEALTRLLRNTTLFSKGGLEELSAKSLEFDDKIKVLDGLNSQDRTVIEQSLSFVIKRMFSQLFDQTDPEFDQALFEVIYYQALEYVNPESTVMYDYSDLKYQIPILQAVDKGIIDLIVNAEVISLLDDVFEAQLKIRPTEPFDSELHIVLPGQDTIKDTQITLPAEFNHGENHLHVWAPNSDLLTVEGSIQIPRVLEIEEVLKSGKLTATDRLLFRITAPRFLNKEISPDKLLSLIKSHDPKDWKRVVDLSPIKTG